MDWLRDERELSFADFNELWEWSVNDLESFWQSIWDYFGLKSSTSFSKVLDEEKMPGASWFKGATVNIVYEIFKDYENLVVGARRGSPLAVGYGHNENFIGSDSYALKTMTNKISYLDDGDFCLLSKEKVEFYNSDKKKINKEIFELSNEDNIVD